MNADGSDQIRLTDNPAMDVVPKLVAGRTPHRVCFRSRRKLGGLRDER